MHHHSQNNDKRYYPYISPGNSQSSRHLSSNDTNENALYNTHLCTPEQPVFHESQHSHTSSNRNLPSLYDSSRYRPSSTTNTIADLLEPLEHRRSIVVSPLSSTHIPSDPSPLSSVNPANLAQAYVLREQLLTNIHHSINDIDRDLTSFEQQPSVSRFPPIIKPNVTSKAGKSSFHAQHEEIKIYENPSLQTMKKNIELRDKYHYESEVDELEILLCSPTNSDDKSTFDEMRETSFHEPFNTKQFLHNLSSRAIIFDSECSVSGQMDFHKSTDELTIDDTESLIETASHRILSPGTNPPHELYPEAEGDLINSTTPIILRTTKDSRPSIETSRTFTIPTDDLRKKSSSSQAVTIYSPPTNNNVNGLATYLFSEFENDEEDLRSMNQSNCIVPTDTNSNLLEQSQVALSILHSAHVSQQQKKTMPATIENNNDHVKVEEKERIKSKKIDATKKPMANTTSILPSSSPSLKKVLLSFIVDGTRTQFALKTNTSNNDRHRKLSNTTVNIDVVDSNREEQENHSNNLRPCLHSSSSLAFQMHSRIQSTKSERNDEETRSISSTSHTPLRNIDNEDTQTPERIDSADQSVKSSVESLSRSSSTASNHTKNNEEITRIDSSAKTSLKSIGRENSTSRRSLSRQSSIAPSEQSHKSRQSHNSSANHKLDQSASSTDDLLKTPTNENEQILDNDKPQSPYDFNEQSQSDDSISQISGSCLTSSASSALPVPLDSSDFEDNEPLRLKIATPIKTSSSTDVPTDPNDPSIMNNTKNFQLPSSQKSNEDLPVSEREKPISSVNVVDIEEFLTHKQSVELPSQLLPKEEQLHEHSSTVYHSPSHEVELQPNHDSPSNPKQEEPLRRTSSPSKSKHQQKQKRHSPSVSSLIRHKDISHSTPSPSLSAHVQNQEQEQKDRLSSGSPPTNETKKHQHNDTRSPSNSSHRSELSDANHASIEDNDTQSIARQNERITSPNHNDNTNKSNIDNDHYQTRKRTLISLPTETTFSTEDRRRPSSEKSVSSQHSQHEPQHDERSHRKDAHHHLASLNHTSNSSSPSVRSTYNDEDLPSMTASQQHPQLSHLGQQKDPKRKKSNSNRSQLRQNNSPRITPINTDEDLLQQNLEERKHRRRVSFSHSPVYSQMEEQPLSTNWRERVATILASKRQPDEKYAYVQARVNSFDNFEYHPRKFKVPPTKKSRPKPPDNEESKFTEHKKIKIKKPKIRKEVFVDDQTDDEQQIQSIKMFGRLMLLPDGSPTIFNEALEWHASSKLKDYLYENFKYTPRRSELKIYNKKPRWHSESKLAELIKESPRFFQRQALVPANSLPSIPDSDQPYFYETRLQQNFPNNTSDDSRPCNTPTSQEKHRWTGDTKLLDTVWENRNTQPKKSKVQIFHKTVVHPSRTTLNNGQIFDEKLNWNARAKVHCWSEIDLRQLKKQKGIVAQYHDPNHAKMISVRPAPKRTSALKDYVWENFNYKSHRRNRKSPPNKPKWNSVSKTRSLNSVYNPKMTNTNTVRRGPDRESRRKRVHKLPPLKRKREYGQVPELPSTAQLAIDYNYDRYLTTQEHTTRNDYGPTPSRRSSKALVPINHHQRYPELELPSETPRSHRPIQQEWYDDMNKSRLTHRTDMEGSINHSFLNSFTPMNQANTPRDLVPYRPSPRNSQNSVISGTLLDPSIRTNRATELRLSKDMDEHHHHCHSVNQSMPFEIRGFELEGTSCTVPADVTIRPLSNVNYRISERVKNRRLYPWSMLHPHGTSSRNSSLLPIAEFRRTSLDTTITET